MIVGYFNVLLLRFQMCVHIHDLVICQRAAKRKNLLFLFLIFHSFHYLIRRNFRADLISRTQSHKNRGPEPQQWGLQKTRMNIFHFPLNFFFSSEFSWIIWDSPQVNKFFWIIRDSLFTFASKLTNLIIGPALPIDGSYKISSVRQSVCQSVMQNSHTSHHKIS